MNEKTVQATAEAEQAFHLEQHVHALLAQMKSSWIELANALLQLKESDRWRYVAEEGASWTEYLKTLDSDFSYEMFSLLMRVAQWWRKLESSDCKEIAESGLTLERFSPTKLDRVRSVVDEAIASCDGQRAVDWLTRALPVNEGGLSRSDLMTALKEEGVVQPQMKKYLLVRGGERTLIKHTNPENLPREWDLVVERPRVVRGIRSLDEDKEE